MKTQTFRSNLSKLETPKVLFSPFQSQGSETGNSKGQSEEETGILIEDRVQTPKMYKVLLLNDDYTPMDFVVLVLKRFFGKSDLEAQKVMLAVHEKGSGVAGVYTLEIAEMKVMQTNQFAQSNEYPLKSILEADE